MEMPYNPLTFSMEAWFVATGLGVIGRIVRHRILPRAALESSDGGVSVRLLRRGNGELLRGVVQGPADPAFRRHGAADGRIRKRRLHLRLGESVLGSFALLAVFCGIIAMLPASKLTKRSLAVNTAQAPRSWSRFPCGSPQPISRKTTDALSMCGAASIPITARIASVLSAAQPADRAAPARGLFAAGSRRDQSREGRRRAMAAEAVEDSPAPRRPTCAPPSWRS